MPDTRKNYNPSGLPDPTRVQAEANMERENREKRRVTTAVNKLRDLAHELGFEIVNRMVLKDCTTGKEYR